MRVYTVHVFAVSDADDGDAILVKEGFSWPAFLFTFFWSLWHGMWVASAGIVAAVTVLAVATELLGVGEATSFVVQLLFQFGIGLFGNDMRRWSLRREGFVETAVVTGADRGDAERRYFTALSAAAAVRP